MSNFELILNIIIVKINKKLIQVNESAFKLLVNNYSAGLFFCA